jgi:hypothetical protein
MPHRLHRAAAAVLSGGSYDHYSSKADHSFHLLYTELRGYTLSISYFLGPFVFIPHAYTCSVSREAPSRRSAASSCPRH